MTLLTSYATHFWHILLLRLGLGIFESTIDLAGASLIADYFQPQNRNIALAIYGFGLYIGVSLSTAGLALINSIGWRHTFLYVGIAGIANSLLMFFVKEPRRGRFDSVSSISGSSNFLVFFKQSVVESFRNPVMRWIIIASAFRISAGFCIGFYYVTYVTKQYPTDSNLFSYFQAGVVLICGTISAYCGGYFSTCLEKRGIKGAKGYIPGFGVLISIPFQILSWVIFRNIYLVLSFNAIGYLFAQNWTGPIFSMIVNVMPVDFRGSAIAILLFVYTVISDIWVVLLGWVLDQVDSNSHPLRIGYWLAIFVCSLYLASVPCYIKLGLNYSRFASKYKEFQELSESQ